jgi:uncharacterized protein with NAD-binding domain and iron-sulfur cluster
MSDNNEARTRVAIVGGGPGGIATAFWLTSTQALRDRFEVTLWTRGWRLGGKGATGRNASEHNRIEEHGLHLWLGFYTDAFRTMREAFAELGPHGTGSFTSIEQAFSPVRQAAFMERDGPGDPPGYLPWIISFLRLPGSPGDPPAETSPLRLLLEWISDHLARNVAPHIQIAGFEELLATLGKLARDHDDPPVDLVRIVLRALHAMLDLARDGPAAPTIDLARTLRRGLILANLAITFALGFITDILLSGDDRAAYDRLDELEFRDWLRMHGAWDISLRCAPLQGIYDLAFAYPNGDATDPLNGAMAAGVSVQLLLHMVLLYKDAPLWKMSAGMGETVFTPLYDVLRRRGVTVNFFHTLEDVAPSGDGMSIAALQFRRQAVVANPPYQPFVTVNGLRCWPSEPDWSQLVDGDALQGACVCFEATPDTTGTPVTLLLGQDFDVVVLAVPPDILKLVTPKLRDHHQGWADMLDNANCIATQAFQLWLSVPSTSLGFPANPPPPLTAYREPYATWADMSHLLPMESWPAVEAPKTISYHCGPMAEMLGGAPGVGDHQAKTEALGWIATASAALWPGTVGRGGGGVNELILSSYFRANNDPSERYALVLPGTIRFRMTPDARPFQNLYLAGDWTRTLVCGGCFENAVQSGMMAAQAISGVVMPIGGT